jgi:hypothetical protein
VDTGSKATAMPATVRSAIMAQAETQASIARAVNKVFKAVVRVRLRALGPGVVARVRLRALDPGAVAVLRVAVPAGKAHGLRGSL